MAGDWIPMREALHEDPAVLAIAERLQTRPEHIVGYCHRFWSFVSRNARDGCLHGVRISSVESVLNLPGFCSMLVEVGWLEETTKDGKPVLVIPKHDRWLSQGAKQRVLAARRQRDHRNQNGVDSVTDMSRDERDDNVTTGQGQDMSLVPKAQAQGIDAAALKKMDWKAVIGDCIEVTQHVKPQKQEDRSLIVKAVVIAHLLFTKDWLLTAAKKARRKPKSSQFAYLHGSLKGKCKDAGRDFNHLLSQIHVPDEILNPPSK